MNRVVRNTSFYNVIFNRSGTGIYLFNAIFINFVLIYRLIDFYNVKHDYINKNNLSIYYYNRSPEVSVQLQYV